MNNRLENQQQSNFWPTLADDHEIFSQISQAFINQQVNTRVAKLNTSLANKGLNEIGMGMDYCVKHLQETIVPNLSASRGPRYWGFVTGGATPVATFADWLVSSFDQNLFKSGDSIAPQVEQQAIKWLCDLFTLPHTFQGSLTTGATAANFLAAITARQYVGNQQGIDVAKDGLFALDINVFSSTPHASMIKSLGMAGLGQRNYRSVDCENRTEKMSSISLQNALKESNVKGKIVIASAGTVTGTDYDDLITISEICKQYDAWLHVDAAFGIFERLLNGKNGKTRGLELADSVTLDCHKWLNVPYDCGVFLTQHRQHLFNSCDVPAPYLANSSDEPDFMSLGIENSRRFRALPVYLSLLAYGKNGVREWTQRAVALAGEFADWIAQSNHYDLVYPCQLNVVLFKPVTTGLTNNEAKQKVEHYLHAINTDGRIFLSLGSWQGESIIRAALSNWQTQKHDIEIAITALTEIAASLE